ncbi:MAG: hypothetical protein IJ763_02975 [Lachnospiraceae bacterium]|nr:hypothetical protein [Lachnospiraceae bacterium]
MSYNYTVQKRKANRISYRIVGIVFLMITILQFITLIKGYTSHIMLTAIFSGALGFYGMYLFLMSFRKQAFDISYKFSEEGMLVTHKYGETSYSYDEIEFITMVIPDESLIYYMLNIKAGKEIYAIPFTNKREYCEKIYEFVNSRIKKKEE